MSRLMTVSDTIVFIECNASYGRGLVRRARDLGFTPLLFTRDRSWYPWLEEDGVTACAIDTRNAWAVLRACRGLAGHDRLRGVTAGYEPYLELAATVAEALGCPGPDAEAVARCHNKDRMRRHLHQSGRPVPAFRVVTAAAEVPPAFEALGAPLVIKPVASGGSYGVRVCYTPASGVQHAECLLGAADERGEPMPPRIMVEKFLDGPEYSVEILDGRAFGVTRKHVAGWPYFVEVGHDYPADPFHHDVAALTASAEAAVETLGLTWGAAHVELKWVRGEAYVIEVNPRLAGGGIADLVELATGADLYGAVIGRIAGDQQPFEVHPVRYASLRSCLPSRFGRVAAVSGVDVARRLPGVHSAEVWVQPGQELVGCGDGRDRIGKVVVTASTSDQAGAVADTASALISVSIADTRIVA